ncbi:MULTISPECIES: DUF3311 domain-containing protein [Rhizobium]|uniref:Uncharacterized membrane protein yhjC n=2 Tax=Rhizobium TaxID=379 RepID=K0PT83_9HYPH|nr:MULTISPECIES: DUF3311 domain-containing protein [Rhizobium]KWV54601.1 permease [Rhizobium altiplani]MDQ0561095.1 hypothetical protein [Rhizobium mesoamericanum]CCM79956.1 Uncharacterized membrane protein yhjC [Rhizobium mesoamericanum STM3625]
MRPIHILALIPVLVAPFFLNRVEPFLLGMPFVLAWLSLMLVLTSVAMACIYVVDKASGAHGSDDLEGASK